MQKVIVVTVTGVLSTIMGKEEFSITHKIKELDEALEQGYKVVNFHQIDSTSANGVVLTFTLEKEN